MMTTAELEQFLLRLDLSAIKAATLLGVTPRTVQRWLDGEEIPGPAEQAVRAWIKLHDRDIPWQPDSQSLNNNDEQQIKGHLRHAVDMAALVSRVEARGGPRMPWQVDYSRGRAVLGHIEVSFYKLLNGGFSLSSYRRGDDVAPDLQRDAELIDDAAYYIAQSRKKEPEFGPVTLVWWDKSPKSTNGIPAQGEIKKFASNEAAIKQACKCMGSRGFYAPIITTKNNEVIFDIQALQWECQRRSSAPTAIAALAKNVRKTSSTFVNRSPRMLTPIATAQHAMRIGMLADKLDALADKARDGVADYQQFEAVLSELHDLGKFPETELVSAVAKALVLGKR